MEEDRQRNVNIKYKFVITVHASGAQIFSSITDEKRSKRGSRHVCWSLLRYKTMKLIYFEENLDKAV